MILHRFSAIFTLFIAAFVLSTCNVPLGLGDPVDIVAPVIVITSPTQNESLGQQVATDPIKIEGIWEDSHGVTSLRAVITDTITKTQYDNVSFTYTVFPDKTWSGTLYLPPLEENYGATEFQIRIIASDRFGNLGAASVTVLVDIQPPWVEEAIILRHKDSMYQQRTLLTKKQYEERINFNNPQAFRTIIYNDIDNYQNESFTLSLTLDRYWIDIAASRLHVFDDKGNKLNPEVNGIIPTAQIGDDLRNPEWKFNESFFTGLPAGINYIQFEVWAWNIANWNGNWDTGSPKNSLEDEASYKRQNIGGTVWYHPETDNPNLRVQLADEDSGQVVLFTGEALNITVYDDDKLSHVYAALIQKDTYLAVRGPSRTEDQFHADIRTNAGGVRDTIISNWSLQNRLEPSVDRITSVSLPATSAGEYRLILFARDDKTTVMFDTPPTPVWSVYPPLIVDVQNEDNPIIVIETPQTENSFPTLTGGETFKMAGYTIDKVYTQFVQISWVPDAIASASGFDLASVRAALTTTAGSDYAFNQRHIVNNIHIWKLPVGAPVKFILNGIEYYKNSFERTFHIVNDFQYNNAVENKTKLFYLHTRSASNADEYKTFRLSSYDDLPTVNVVYPIRDNMIHSTLLPITLQMTATAGKVGLKSGWNGVRIRDVTNTPSAQYNTNINAQDSYPFLGEMVAGANNSYARTLSRDTSNAANNSYFSEGARKVYLFEAEDILGNRRVIERKVIMSNASSVMYIDSQNAANTYGIGTTLRFTAVFSMPVDVTGSPRLKLFQNEPNNTTGQAATRTANYVTGTGSNILIFEYTVVENDNIAQLHTARDSLQLNGGTIRFTAQDGTVGNAIIDMTVENQAIQSLQKLKPGIGINGVRPRVTRAAFTQIDPLYSDTPHPGYSYFNEGKIITLELTVDKPVRISGIPQALLSWTGINPAAGVHANYSSIEDGNTVIKFTYEVPNTVYDSTQVRWGTGSSSAAGNPWVVLSAATNNNITDNFGNQLSLASIPSQDNWFGNQVGANPNQRAYILTRQPANATLEIHTNTALDSPITGTADILRNAVLYLKNNRPTTNPTFFFYSLAGGSSPKKLTTQTYAELADEFAALKLSADDYQMSTYAVTAWYEDYAGNRSQDNAVIRNVTINSRAPELVAINSTSPNGNYNTGKTVNFTLNFSKPYVASAGAKVTLDLRGSNAAISTGSNEITNIITDIAASPANSNSGTQMSITLTVTSGKRLSDIKATRIAFTGIKDEYGNDFILHQGTAAETATQRPITNNLNRPQIIIDSIGPRINAYSPGAGSTYGTLYANGIESATVYANGGVMTTGNRTITLRYDKHVFAQSGKTIIVRPYGDWGVPPVLTNEMMDSLYNAEFFNHTTSIYNPTASTQKEEFQKRLKWLRPDGLPETSQTIRASYTDAQATAVLTERHRYNYYVNTTRGLINTAGNFVRPSLTGQWVLAFRHDIFNGISGLREVYNAAEWNWIRMLSTSTEINNAADGTATVKITLPNELPKGRIWEVLIEEAAFRDAAGNETIELAANTYRFWSDGTETPVIRVDRYSHSDHFHGLFDSQSNMWSPYGINNIPKIDTRVRIDCETPGASIWYDTVRTSYKMAAAGNSTTSSQVFTTVATAATGKTTDNTGEGFFNHPNINFNVNSTHANYSGNTATSVADLPSVYGTRGANPGFANNWIGNAGSHFNGSQKPIPKDSDGYFSSLLVPIQDESNNAAIPIGQNGAIASSVLTTRGNDLKTTQTGGNRRSYTTYSPTATETRDGSVFLAYTNNTTGRIETTSATTNTAGRFFYVGDAYKTTGTLNDRNAAGIEDSSLYSGRRDYVVAVARKDIISSGTAAIRGPALAVSTDYDREGVFKTTVIHRNPTGRNQNNTTHPGTPNGTAAIYMQGFDFPVNTTVAGFPLNESTVPFPVGDSGANRHLDYFTRMLWRQPHTTGATARPANHPDARLNNNYIWVSWDIVVDWYQKGRCRGYAQTTNNPPNGALQEGGSLRRDGNYDAILCTYGAVNYRFEQTYWTGASGYGFQ